MNIKSKKYYSAWKLAKPLCAETKESVDESRMFWKIPYLIAMDNLRRYIRTPVSFFFGGETLVVDGRPRLVKVALVLILDKHFATYI